MKLIRLAAKNLLRQKRRSILLGSAIAFGILFVTLINGFTGSFIKNVGENFSNLLAGHIFIDGVEKSETGKELYIIRDDSALMDSFSSIKPDIAMLPIGGTLTMDLIDAVRATKTMKPDYVIPMHYNTFEEIKADPAEFKEQIEKSVLKTKPLIMKPGQALKF